MKRKLVIVGAGGQAREVRWIIAEMNRVREEFEVLGYVVTDLSSLGKRDSQNEVLGDYSWIEKNGSSVDCLALGIGSPAARFSVAHELERRFPKLDWPPLIHPAAMFDQGSCKIGRGVLICPGVVGTVNLVFEAFCMINVSCTVGHEAVIGKGTVVNPGANIAGGVVLGDRVLVGSGAQILQYISVGNDARVGAGAVVTKPVGPGETVVGVPARPRPA